MIIDSDFRITLVIILDLGGWCQVILVACYVCKVHICVFLWNIRQSRVFSVGSNRTDLCARIFCCIWILRHCCMAVSLQMSRDKEFEALIVD